MSNTDDIRTVISHLPDVVFSGIQDENQNFTFTFLSPAIFPLCGIDAESLMNDAGLFFKQLSKADNAALQQATMDCCHNNTALLFEAVIQTANNGSRWLECRAKPNRSPRHDGYDWHGLLMDITDRKQREIELLRQKNTFESISMNSPHNIIYYDRNKTVQVANPSVLNTLNLSAEKILGRRYEDILVELSLQSLGKIIDMVMRLGVPQSVEVPISKPGQPPTIHVIRFVADQDQSGKIVGVIGYGEDINELHNTQKALLESRNQAHSVISAIPDLIWLRNLDGRYIMCNKQFEHHAGMLEHDIIDKTNQHFFNEDAGKALNIADKQVISYNKLFTHTVRNPFKKQTNQHVFEVRNIAIHDIHQQPVGILTVAHDITEKERMKEVLINRERSFKSLAEHIPDIVFRYGVKNEILYCNDKATQFMGEFLELDMTKVSSVHKLDPSRLPEYLFNFFTQIVQTTQQVIQTRKPARRELVISNLKGQRVMHEIRFVPEIHENDSISSVLAIGRDITARKKMEAELKHKEQALEIQAFNDPLTGLPNRRKFSQLLKNALNESVNSDQLAALLVLDLDRFKTINDNLGHLPGDELLKKLSLRLLSCLQGRGHVARIGGDEFVVILSRLDGADEAHKVANNILTAAAKPIMIGGYSISITVSIGLSLGPTDSSDENELFRFADIALYKAKELGRNTICSYTKQLSDKSRERFEMENHIKRALANREFFPYFQAKVDLNNNQIVGAEALCRWQHPELGWVAPAEFITIAEETGQIIELGQQILLQTCEFAVQCNYNQPVPFVIAVNLSPQQMLFGNFLQTLDQCLNETGCNPAWLELEITEGILLSEEKSVFTVLNHLKELGISIAIDDFGTGYSSLSYLSRFPINTLKIDRSFTTNVLSDPVKAVLVNTIQAMANGLGLRTVAEGIETESELKHLRASGCHYGQGFFWHRPSTATELLSLIQQQDQHTARQTAPQGQ